MATTTGKLGEFEYTHEYRKGYGHRVIWNNPPPAGTELLATFDEPVVVDEIGPAGMVVHTRKSDGFQGMSFPHDLKVPNVYWMAATPQFGKERHLSQQTRRLKMPTGSGFPSGAPGSGG